jgi:hypothetical protein
MPMKTREISHIELMIHIGEAVGVGNACSQYNFELGHCYATDDADEDKVTGKAVALDNDEAAATLVEAIDNYLRKDLGTSVRQVIDDLEAGQSR